MRLSDKQERLLRAALFAGAQAYLLEKHHGHSAVPSHRDVLTATLAISMKMEAVRLGRISEGGAMLALKGQRGRGNERRPSRKVTAWSPTAEDTEARIRRLERRTFEQVSILGQSANAVDVCDAVLEVFETLVPGKTQAQRDRRWQAMMFQADGASLAQIGEAICQERDPGRPLDKAATDYLIASGYKAIDAVLGPMVSEAIERAMTPQARVLRERTRLRLAEHGNAVNYAERCLAEAELEASDPELADLYQRVAETIVATA